MVTKKNPSGGKNKSSDDDMQFLFDMQKKNEKETLVAQQQSEKKKKQPPPKVYPLKQTTPEPTVPIKHLHKDGNFPQGEIQQHGFYEAKTKRFVAAELKPGAQERDEKLQERIQEARQAAEVHRTARKWFKDHVVKPGMKIIDAAETYEAKVRELLDAATQMKGGLAFPLGCSFNHVAAHYSPNGGDETVIGKDDVVKFDLGVHVNGTIIDSAFTVCWNDQYLNLLEAVKDATNTGVKTAGIDVRLGDVGANIQEVMESYEVVRFQSMLNFSHF